MGRIPDLPGQLLERGSSQESWLRSHVANLCSLPHDRCARCSMRESARIATNVCDARFPGAQPVSFAERDLDRLVESEYVYLGRALRGVGMG